MTLMNDFANRYFLLMNTNVASLSVGVNVQPIQTTLSARISISLEVIWLSVHSWSNPPVERVVGGPHTLSDISALKARDEGPSGDDLSCRPRGLGTLRLL